MDSETGVPGMAKTPGKPRHTCVTIQLELAKLLTFVVITVYKTPSQ